MPSTVEQPLHAAIMRSLPEISVFAQLWNRHTEQQQRQAEINARVRAVELVLEHFRSGFTGTKDRDEAILALADKYSRFFLTGATNNG